MDNKILLVVKDEIRKSAYLGLLDKYDVCWNVVGSLKEAINHASEDPHNGILIDMPLLIRTSAAVKIAVDDLLGALPGATLNFNALSGELRILPRGEKSSDCSSIEQFIAICAKFHPRILFSKKRVPIHYNALLAITPDLENSDRTVCIDISIGGCFLFCVKEDISINSPVWIKLVGLNYENPIEGIVKWICKWGTTNKIPGIGVEFHHLSDELRKLLTTLIGNNYPGFNTD